LQSRPDGTPKDTLKHIREAKVRRLKFAAHEMK